MSEPAQHEGVDRVVSTDPVGPVGPAAPSNPSREAAFTAFMHESWPALLRTARLLAADEPSAQDLAQHALVRTYEHWARAEDRPLAYARRVMANRRIDVWRRLRRERLAASVDLMTVADSADALAELDTLRRALAGLGDRQRAVVVLRYVDDLSEEEVAELLGITVGTVKSTAHRGLRKLRGLLDGPATPAPPPPGPPNGTEVTR